MLLIMKFIYIINSLVIESFLPTVILLLLSSIVPFMDYCDSKELTIIELIKMKLLVKRQALAFELSSSELLVVQVKQKMKFLLSLSTLSSFFSTFLQLFQNPNWKKIYKFSILVLTSSTSLIYFFMSDDLFGFWVWLMHKSRTLERVDFKKAQPTIISRKNLWKYLNAAKLLSFLFF